MSAFQGVGIGLLLTLPILTVATKNWTTEHPLCVLYFQYIQIIQPNIYPVSSVSEPSNVCFPRRWNRSASHSPNPHRSDQELDHGSPLYTHYCTYHALRLWVHSYAGIKTRGKFIVDRFMCGIREQK